MCWNLPKSASIVLAAVLCAVVAACASDGTGASSGNGASPFAVVLPNGYLIDRDNSSNTRIVKRSGALVVPGPIAGYTVIHNIVTGYVGTPPPVDSTGPTPPPPENTAPYFVIDTTSGKVDRDLSTAAWNGRLKELGAPAAPEIMAPMLPR